MYFPCSHTDIMAMEIPAAIIGVTTNGNDRVVVNGEEKRFLEKRYQDALLQIHPEYISEADKVKKKKKGFLK